MSHSLVDWSCIVVCVIRLCAVSVIYHHYLILVSGEVLYESVNADTGRHVLLCPVSE